MAAGSRRLFFALWPDAALRHRLLHWQTAHLPADVRWQHRADLHMTLHFLGSVTSDMTGRLVELGAALEPQAFDLTIDRIGHWPGPGVLWAGPSQVPAALIALHAALAEGLCALGLDVETRPYRAHVTLARTVRAPLDAGIMPLVWQVRRWALVESRPGEAPHYRPLAQWRMTNRPTTLENQERTN
jgi:2'-5' RNA ligase